MTEFHLPLLAERACKRRRWTRIQADNLLVEFFRMNAGVLQDAPFSTQLGEFFNMKATEEEQAEAATTLSLLIEHAKKDGFRAIIFETDWKGTSSVLNIAASQKLTELKKWFAKTYPNCRAVYLGSDERYRFVSDPFLTATCLMKPPTEAD